MTAAEASRRCGIPVKAKELRKAESIVRRQTTEYYDAMASANQISGNAPHSVEVCAVLLFLAGEA